MNVLIIGEESQTICKAFRAKGHNAFSNDLKHCSGGHPEWHIIADCFTLLKAHNFYTQSGKLVSVEKWDLLIAHPPCTYLTITANIWFKEQVPRKSGALVGSARYHARNEALIFVRDLMNAPVKKVCIENPVGCISTRIYWESILDEWFVSSKPVKNGRKPEQIIQPFQFGHPEPKKTCLWLKGLPLLKHTKIVEPEYHITKSGKRVPKWFFYADRSKDRAEIRSKTFPGIAEAMAEQWGKI